MASTSPMGTPSSHRWETKASPSGWACPGDASPAQATSVDAVNRRWTAIAQHAVTALQLRAAQVSGAIADLGRRAPQGTGLSEQLSRLEHAQNDTPAEAASLEAWAGLLAGRFSIVRTRRDGGRLTWLAVENPETDARRALTPSERTLVELASTGAPLKHLALDLELAETTVATTLGHALRKLGVSSRAELVALAGGLRHG
jgi:DNA-binding CsgD family transcriptional regulator